MNIKKVIHIIPYDGTGGVESAARSMENKTFNTIKFKIHYIFKNHQNKLITLRKFNPFIYFHSAFKVVQQKPDLLIVSLWRSCMVALIAMLFLRNTKIVLFLHYPDNVHFVDRILTNLVSYFSSELWADSKATFENRISSQRRINKRVISFVTFRLDPLTSKHINKNFIFWGRLHKQKGLHRAIEIFNQIKSQSTQSKFFIIGPDGGEEKSLKKLVNRLQLDKSILFLGEMPFSKIENYAQNASFYLQPSLLEGMAMSVVEAMQLGLVPIVTPVGEIRHYCKNNNNAILIDQNNLFLEDVNKLLIDHNKYAQFRQNAISSWSSHEIYHESVNAAAEQVMS